MLHADEFAQTTDNEAKIRISLFPKGILSMFGIEPEDSSPAPNVSALQNFIKHPKKEGSFTSLSFFPEPMLKYVENGESKSLSLNDRSRVQQIYFGRRLYHPRKTDLRIDKMVFLLNWLTRNDISWKFEDYCDLTILTLKDRYRVKMFYSYCLSINDLYNTSLSAVDCVVNLHNWNNGPSSTEAIEYARSFGIKIYNQNQFFVFCHKKIRELYT